MALDILHDNWGPYTHTEVENALKAYLAGLEQRINQAIQQGGIGLEDLSQEVQGLLAKANTALQPSDIAAWAKAQNKPGYTADEITGITGFQNLLAKLQDMDAKIQAAGQDGGDPDDEMSSTSEKPVQNKVIKAYVDAVSQRIDTLIGSGNVQGAIDTFNEVVAFLNGIDTDDPTLANQLLALQTALAGKVSGIKTSDNTPLTPDSNGVVTLPPAGSTISPATASPSMDGTANVGSSDKYAREDHVHPHDSSKQNTLTFDTTPTTGHTTQVMSSDSIKTAISLVTPTIDENGKWVIGGVTTDKDAQGPRGNTVLVNENAQGIQALIVNNVADGGETDILSAEMGKVIRQNIMRIFNALGTYAFPNGKPILNWGSTVMRFGISATLHNVTISSIKIDGVTQSYSSLRDIQITDGKALEVTLDLPSNLYVIDDSTFLVKVLGSPINTSVQGNSIVEDIDNAQVIITIASVDGDVAIIASALTYIGVDGFSLGNSSDNSLKSMFDGKHVDSANNQWVDMMEEHRILSLYNCDVQSDHVYFNGSDAYAFAENQNTDYNGVDVDAATGTIEAVLTDEKTAATSGYAYTFVNKLYAAGHKLVLTMMNTSAGGTNRIVAGWSQANDSTDSNSASFPKAWNLATTSLQSVSCLSISATRCYLNGQSKNKDTYPFAEIPNSSSSLGINNRITGNGGRFYGKGSVYCIRVYSKTLTVDEISHNNKIDMKRFNIS